MKNLKEVTEIKEIIKLTTHQKTILTFIGFLLFVSLITYLAIYHQRGLQISACCVLCLVVLFFIYYVIYSLYKDIL